MFPQVGVANLQEVKLTEKLTCEKQKVIKKCNSILCFLIHPYDEN